MIAHKKKQEILVEKLKEEKRKEQIAVDNLNKEIAEFKNVPIKEVSK